MTDNEGRCTLCGMKPRMTVDGMVWHKPSCPYVSPVRGCAYALPISIAVWLTLLVAVWLIASFCFRTV